MAVKRLAGRLLIVGNTDIHLQDWSHTVTVWLATNPEKTAFAKRLQLDAQGNARVAGHVISRSEIR